MNLIIAKPIRTAIVIGTYGSIPYIHLQLEALNRFNSGTPVLVHDDSSEKKDELKKLCSLYGADFISTDQHKTIAVGDLSAFTFGLKWAQHNEIDLLLKVSRRYIIAKPWVNSLIELAIGSQEVTYSNACSQFNYGFRSECVGMYVPAWMHPEIINDMSEKVQANVPFDPVPEAYYHRLAKLSKAITYQYCDKNHILIRHNTFFGRGDNWGGYAPWPLMGLSRNHKLPDVLWHDANSTNEYAYLSKQWNMPYTKEEFDKVNN